MPLDLALTMRRENPVLEPFFDQLEEITESMDAGIYRVETNCFTLLTYRGPIPQTHALSLSWPRQALGNWVRALETGRPIISGDADDTTAQIANLQSPLKTLVALPPDITPRSVLVVPLVGETGISYVLAIGHSDPRYFTPELADQILRFAQAHMQTIETGARHAELAQRAVEAEILLSVQRSITRRLDQQAALHLVADEARNITFAQSACILALEQDRLTLQAFSGKDSTYPSDCDGWTVDGSAIHELDGAISPRRGDIATWLGAPAATWLSQRDFLAAPLRRGTQVTGMLVVVDKRLGVFDSRDERRLAMLASVSGVCLENARLYQQARQVAALEERDRLSRELHDELAQALSYLKMQASLVEASLVEASTSEGEVASGDGETAQAHLAELRAVLDVAYASVREAIFGLRHKVAGGSDFFASLQPFLADYRTHYGLNATADTALDPPPELEPEVELQLARIVQEALTNVRRHAVAKQVQVKAEREPGLLVVRIIDDGKGFDVDAVLGAEGQRFGLQIMRERAATFGGQVQIQSIPGSGSEVIITIPESQDWRWTH